MSSSHCDSFTPLRCVFALALGLCPLFTAGVPAGQTKPERVAGLVDALRELTREARAIAAGKAEPRREASFAKHFDGVIDPEKLARRIVRAIDGDPFIDAYVRWQLTSFDPPLHDFSDRRFEALLRNLPPLVENPCADESLLATLQQFAEAGPLDEVRRRVVREEIDAANELAARAELRNEPANQLREWIERQCTECSVRALKVQIERCDARVAAGWPVEGAKEHLERCLERVGEEQRLSDEDLRQIARLLPALTRTRRLYLAGASFAGESLVLDLADTAVYDFEVRRWLRTLEGHE